MRAIAALLLASLALAGPLAAADLVEPWAPGLSNLELAVARSSGGARAASSLVGGGLTDRISLGLMAGSEEGGETSYGALLLYSQPLGRAGEVDVWCESTFEAPGDDAACGLEWSRGHARFVPYARLTGAWQGGGDSLAPLAGVVVPVTEALGLHVELSLEAAEEAGRPIRAALGPNWAVGPRLELIPELAWTRSPGGESSFDFALCLAMGVSRSGPRGGQVSYSAEAGP